MKIEFKRIRFVKIVVDLTSSDNLNQGGAEVAVDRKIRIAKSKKRKKSVVISVSNYEFIINNKTQQFEFESIYEVTDGEFSEEERDSLDEIVQAISIPLEATMIRETLRKFSLIVDEEAFVTGAQISVK